MTESLAVNMITYNGLGSFIKEAIDAVRPLVDEIVVTDTGSTDGTYEWLQTIPDIKLLHEDVQKLGKIWTDSRLDYRLTELLNEMKDQTDSSWIVRVDDDEIFTHQLLREIRNMEKTSLIYSVPFRHVGTSDKQFLIKRVFKKCPEVYWKGPHGYREGETLTIRGARLSSRKCPAFQHLFYHLGSLKKNIGDRNHDYSMWT